MEENSKKTIIVIGIGLTVLLILTISFFFISTSDKENKGEKVETEYLEPSSTANPTPTSTTDKKFYDSIEERNAALEEQISGITGKPLSDDELEAENFDGYLE